MINTSIGLLGVARQKDKATAATEPTFKHGLTGGGLIKPERTVEQKNVACGLRANTTNGAYVSEVNLAVDFETLAYADALGLYMLAAMGNVVTSAASKSGYGVPVRQKPQVRHVLLGEAVDGRADPRPYLALNRIALYVFGHQNANSVLFSQPVGIGKPAPDCVLLRFRTLHRLSLLSAFSIFLEMRPSFRHRGEGVSMEARDKSDAAMWAR